MSEPAGVEVEPQQVTCSGGIELPSLALLFGPRGPLSGTETGQENQDG